MSRARAVYTRSVLGARDQVLEVALRRSLLERRMPTIQVDDATGRLLQMLVSVQAPLHAIEIGTLFGYSTIHIARGLPPGGRLTTLEVDAVAAELARENLADAGLANRVDVVVGDADDHLAGLAPGSIGFVFLDGDKRSYPQYLKRCFPLLEPGGLIVADDAFADGDYDAERNGAATDAESKGIEAAAIQTYARAVGASPLLFSVLVPTDAGLMVSRRVSS